MKNFPAALCCNARQSATRIHHRGVSNGGKDLEVGETIRIRERSGQIETMRCDEPIEELTFSDPVGIRGFGVSRESARATFELPTEDGVGLEVRAQRRDQKIWKAGEDRKST